MNITMEEKKAEAIVRMEMLRLPADIIRQFAENGTVNICVPQGDAFFRANGDDAEGIREMEKKEGNLVYVGIRSFVRKGKLGNFLFVGDQREEWDNERKEIENMDNGIWAYVYDCDVPECSEFTYIGVEHTAAGGLLIVW